MRGSVSSQALPEASTTQREPGARHALLGTLHCVCWREGALLARRAAQTLCCQQLARRCRARRRVCMLRRCTQPHRQRPSPCRRHGQATHHSDLTSTAVKPSAQVVQIVGSVAQSLQSGMFGHCAAAPPASSNAAAATSANVRMAPAARQGAAFVQAGKAGCHSSRAQPPAKPQLRFCGSQAAGRQREAGAAPQEAGGRRRLWAVVQQPHRRAAGPARCCLGPLRAARRPRMQSLKCASSPRTKQTRGVRPLH